MYRVAAICALLPAMSALAAGPQPGFLADLAETRGFMLGRPVRPMPTPDGKSVLFLRSPPRSPEQSLYAFDVTTGKTRELLTPERLLGGASEHLTDAEKARRERQRVTSRGFTSFELSPDGSFLLVPFSGRLYTVRLADGASTEIAGGEPAPEVPQLSPDGKRVAYVRDRDLYALELATKKETRLTHSEHDGVTNGLAEFVAQEELERQVGFWWSPDGKSIAFEEADSRAVESFYLADPAHPERAPLASPYPRPGKANATLRLGIVGVEGGSPTWVKWDAARFPYLATVTWRDHAPLTIVVLSRTQRDLEVRKVDAHGGTERLVAEHDDAWLNLDQSTPRWLPDGSAFLWASEREGTWRLEVRAPDGGLLRTLAPEAGYRALAAIDLEHRVAFIHASREPTELHVARVPLEGGAVEWLTRDEGDHVAVVGRDRSIWIDTVTTLAAMPRSLVRRFDGSSAGEIPSVAESPPIEVKAEIAQAGDEHFRAILVRPRDFDRSKKYPVVLDVYGGPHVLNVRRALPTALMRQWIADHGFVVVSIDGRGTPDRGRAWERAIRGNFAEVTLDDQVAALQALGHHFAELDLSRVGVYGWSFGGYMAALAVLKRPDVFKVGVAGAPVVDWRDYDTAYTERYLGLPDENPKGYDGSALTTFADRLSRPLLLIHGTTDDNVYFLHTIKLAEALFRAGKPFELLPLSGFTHMVPDPVVRERLYERIVGMLAAELRPGT